MVKNRIYPKWNKKIEFYFYPHHQIHSVDFHILVPMRLQVFDERPSAYFSFVELVSMERTKSTFVILI